MRALWKELIAPGLLYLLGFAVFFGLLRGGLWLFSNVWLSFSL